MSGSYLEQCAKNAMLKRNELHDLLISYPIAILVRDIWMNNFGRTLTTIIWNQSESVWTFLTLPQKLMSHTARDCARIFRVCVWVYAKTVTFSNCENAPNFQID